MFMSYMYMHCTGQKLINGKCFQWQQITLSRRVKRVTSKVKTIYLKYKSINIHVFILTHMDVSFIMVVSNVVRHNILASSGTWLRTQVFQSFCNKIAFFPWQALVRFAYFSSMRNKTIFQSYYKQVSLKYVVWCDCCL